MDLKPEELLRVELGPLKFSDGKPYFERVLSLFGELSKSNLDTVPFPQLTNIKKHTVDARKRLNAIREFSLEKHPENPAAVRDGLIQDIAASYDRYFTQLSPLIAFSVRKGTDFERLEKEAQSSLEGIRALASQTKEQTQAQLQGLEDTIEEVRRAAQEVGVAQHATHFKDEAEDHDRASDGWLKTTIVLTGMTTVLAVVFTTYSTALIHGWIDNVTLDSTQAVQLAVSKVLLFGLAVGWRLEWAEL